MKEIHGLPCLKRKLVHSALWCIWSVDKKQICQTQRMEWFIITYQGWVLLPWNVIDGRQPLESKKYQVEFDPGRRELVSTSEKIKFLHKIVIKTYFKTNVLRFRQIFSKKEGMMWVAYGSNGGWLMRRVDVVSFI